MSPARLMFFVSVTTLATGCGTSSGTADGPPSIPLVDLFGQDDVAVSDSPTLSTPPRAAWRFADTAPAGLPEASATTWGWTSRGDVTGLTLSNGRLVGETDSEFPILHVSWDDDQGNPDELHSVEISLSVSAGENLRLTFQDSDTPDVESVRAADWVLETPIIPGDEVRTYTIANDGGTNTSDIRQIFVRPTDVSGARFEIESIRFVFAKEQLAETPSGVGWHGLSEIYHESLVAKAPETIRMPLSLPARPWLDLSIGTLEDRPVTFHVGVEQEGAGTPHVLLERTVTTPDRWEDASIDLTDFAGQDITLSLSLSAADAGTIGFWGSPVVRNDGQPPRGTGDPPQGVILIMADTLRRDHLDAYGYARETAPVLSRMASEGTLFRDNISQASWTKVSTPSILTSLYPTTHTVKQVPDRLPSSANTLAEAYRAAGHATLSFSSVTFSGQSSNMHQGFEELHEAGSRTADNVTKSAREYVDRLLPWLEEHKDVPFFVFLHVFDPHSPFTPRPPYDSLWADPTKTADFEKDLDRVREFIETATLRDRGMPSREEILEAGVDPEQFISQYHDWYDGSIRGMDVEIGRLLEGLQALGLADSTLIAFIGDHGEEFLDHGRTWHGHTLYGELVNVPLLLWWPGGVPAGVTVDETVRSIDLMPTLLALSGLTAPEEIQGQSLLPLMGDPAGNAAGAEEWIVRPAGSERDLGDGRSLSIVSDGWKLVQNFDLPDEEHPEFELFDHGEDPLDLVNVAGEHPDIVERLSREIDRWQRQAEVAQLQSDEELGSSLSAEELTRLRSLGYVR